ncbi:MAG: CTP synthase [Candidatus Uhrbacteria bacterium]
MAKHRRTFVFIAGGVMSGVGKGVASASIGAIMKARGLRVTAVKIDPYINVDAGTMNPIEHGEVFVTRDGDETDQDIGNYERFLDEDILKVNYMTTGRVYLSVIQRERALGYGGKTVEVVPHVPEEVISRIKAAAEHHNADVTVIEIGGTVGEYQNILFLEAARILQHDQPQDVLIGLVSYLPVPGNLGEMKTKPTQYAVRTLNSAGLQPDFIIGRSSEAIDQVRKQKMALHCSVQADEIISAPDVSSIYDVPAHFEAEGLGKLIERKLKLKTKKPDLREWNALTRRIENNRNSLPIGIISKYTTSGSFNLSDAYLSVTEAIKHACWKIGRKPTLIWIDAEALEKNPNEAHKLLKGLKGIIVPGGFGSRGIEGKIRAIQYAREKKIPFLGLCYGMQLATVEFARHVLGLKTAHTTEIDPTTSDPVIHLMNEQGEKMKHKEYGGSMRLGDFPCHVRGGTNARKLYGTEMVMERHRHRFEYNPAYRERFEKAGLISSGTSPDETLTEIIEIPKHPFFMGSQFHPEYKSRPMKPHPLFLGFAKAITK